MTHSTIQDIGEITPAVSRFEATHPVETYTIDGIRVWPLLRSWVALTRFLRTSDVAEKTAFDETTDDRPSISPAAKGGSLKRFAPVALKQFYWTTRFRLMQWGKDRFEKAGPWEWRRDERPDASGRDVVLVTHSNRRVPIDGWLWHTIADPLDRLLDEHGLTLSVWEWGERRGPRRNRSAWIGALEVRRSHEAVRRSSRPGPNANAPDWFGEYREFASTILERPVTWRECLYRILLLQSLADDFSVWLRRGRARCVLIDTWYTAAGRAAVLAARRLGIPSIEVQHGTEGPLHPAYAGWSGIPEGGYELVPQYQWAWGEAHTRIVPDAERPTLRSFVGGNPWVNLWRDGHEPAFEQESERFKRLRGTASLSVLVTTQPVVDLEPVFEAIAASPADWCWFVRFHRATEAAAIEEATRRLLATGHGSVHVHQGHEGPLQAAFTAADVHVTGFSTCAMEALAFGKPTVLIHPIGLATFVDAIHEGAMLNATASGPQCESLLDAIIQAAKISADRCRDASDAFLASSATCRDDLSDFFSRLRPASDFPIRESKGSS